jgi:hypothetical protein
MYVPGFTDKEKAPSLLVAAPFDWPCNVTEAPDNGLPLASLTVPFKVAVCASANNVLNKKNNRNDVLF